MKLAFVTLHVGAGTFQPVRVDNIAEHRMHSELYDIPPATVEAIAQAHASGGRVAAVAPPACARWNPPRAAASWPPARARPIFSSPRAIAFAWWTGC